MLRNVRWGARAVVAIQGRRGLTGERTKKLQNQTSSTSTRGITLHIWAAIPGQRARNESDARVYSCYLSRSHGQASPWKGYSGAKGRAAPLSRPARTDRKNVFTLL